MKKGWEYKKLGNVCTFINGFAFKSNKFTNEGSPIIRISDIQNGMVDDTNVVYFDINSYSENLSKYKVYPNDILIAMSGGTTGKIGINYTNKEFYLNQRVGVFRENTSVLNHMFLFYFLQTKGTESLVIAAGAAQPNLSTAQIKNFVIPLPPLSEQKEIVEYLDSSFAKIDKLKENAAKNLEEAKALFQSALKNALEPKEGWEEKTLKEICEKIFAGGDAPKNFTLEKNKTNNIPIFANAVKNDGLYGYTDKAVVTEPCVTIAARGSGTGFTLRRYTPFVPIVRLIVALPQREKISIDFLYYFLVKTNVSSSGSAIPQLTIPMIKAYRCVFPPLSEQQSIVSFLDSLNEKVNTLQQNYSRICDECDALKQAILRQVFE